MKLKRVINYGFIIIFCFSFIFLFCACENQDKPKFIASLSTTKVSNESLSLSFNSEPALIQFSQETTPNLHEVFGGETYNLINICLSGIVSKEQAKLSATPIKEDGSIWTEQDNPEDLFCYTDYFQFAFKITDITKTIRFNKSEPFLSLNKNRVINNYYYMNFKWLNLSADQETIKSYEYDNENYIYVETKDYESMDELKFLIHLTFDLQFV